MNPLTPSLEEWFRPERFAGPKVIEEEEGSSGDE